MTPTLPIELIQHILADAWTGPLSTAERITLSTSSALVSTVWAASFAALATRDVHITCAAAANVFLARTAVDSAANAAVRSLTFHLTHTSSMDIGAGVQNDIGETLSRTLCAISADALCPNLRRVSIRYTNFGTDDVVRYTRLFIFSPQVTTLEVHYAFDAQCLPSSVARLRSRPARDASVLDALPNVRKLVVIGAGAGFVEDLVRMCKAVAEVETDRMPKSRRGLVPVCSEEDIAQAKMLRKLLEASIARDEAIAAAW